ncbi:MAG: putative capsid protein [Circoviridae sp.]|nr:MAG: putative capsid protein [Circoviridae sp.]
MAKRKYNQKARALQPAVMKLHFAADVNTSNFISISNAVSRLNRRFYRQGLNWAVANVRVTVQPAASTAIGSSCYINSIPHTWTVANAWVKAFHAWKNQQDQAIEAMGAESAVARYRDFKVSADIDHTVGTNLSPVSMGPGTTAGPYPPGLITGQQIDAPEEWEASQIVIPNDGAPGNTVEYNLHMVGATTATSKGIIAGYEFSRAFPQSPDPATPSIETSWLNRMQDVGDNSDEIVTNAQNNNAELPYDQNSYPGGVTNFVQLETQGYVLNQSSVGINTYNTGAFTAPCGIIRVDFHDQAPGELLKNIITVELVPGSHRGYLCESMEEF